MFNGEIFTMGRDIHAYRAAQMRDSMAGKPVISDEDIVLQILKDKVVTVKTEEIVNAVSERLGLDIEDARELTAAALRKLCEQGAVMHLGYAYWNYVLR